MAATENGGSLSPEIARLAAQVAKDPGSRLFMPLAEEYLKAGMTGEAVSVLENGLKANPNYMSARVLLGKAYLEAGDTGKAKEQFEAVVKAIPDNLLAHRKLGEIYMGMGMRTEAARSFKMITLLNPKDEEAKALLKEAEAPIADEEPAVIEAEAAVPEPHEAPMFDISEVGQAEDEPESDIPFPQDQFAAAYELPAPAPEFPAVNIEEVPAAPDIFSSFEAVPEPDEQMEGPVKGYSINASAQSQLEDIFSAYSEPPDEEKHEESPAGIYEINDDLSSFEVESFSPQVHEETPTDAKEVFETETLAELYIGQGFYDRAIEIYKKLIVESPDDMRLKQELEDLYLLANIGQKKDEEEAVDVLEADLADVLPAWQDEPRETDAMDLWEFYVEPGKDEAAEPLPVPKAKNGEVIYRLEKFLEKIRRKAGK